MCISTCQPVQGQIEQLADKLTFLLKFVSNGFVSRMPDGQVQLDI